MSKTLKERFAEVTTTLADLLKTEIKFLDFKLTDGTIVRCDTEALQIGSKVDAIDEKGNALALPNGEYTNPESGVKFSVEEGYVKNTVAPQAQATPPTGGGQANAPDLAALAAQVKDLLDRVAALEKGEQGEAPSMDDMNKISQAHAETKKTVETLAKTFNAFVGTVEEAFAGEPTGGKPKNLGNGNAETDEEKIKKFRKQHLNIQ